MSIASTTCEVFNAIPAPVSSYPANDHPAADAWARHAGALAAWTERHLVNRRDAFGRYIAIERRAGRHTASTDKAALTRAVLERHYRGRSTGDLIGLHAIVRAEGEAAACRSRWLGVDIDRHDETVDPEATWRAARAWYDRALGLGFRPLLLDSNGDGGYHLVLIFAEPVPTERVFTFGQRLVRDWKDLGLAKAPEIFPKQASIQPGEFGNWLRLPGRHHTRHHYTRVWDGQSWLEGEATIQAILNTTGSAATLIPAEVLESRRVERRDEMMEWFAAVTNRDRDLELARQALEHLDPMADGYDEWIKVGMCLRTLGDAGLVLWDEWSRQSTKYEEGVCSQKWETFSEDGGLTLGTLFYLAKQHGWEGPREFYTPPAPVFANSAKDGEEEKAALRMGQLAECLDAITPGWPKRLDERLFVAGADDNPVYLDSAARLFA
ncbi:MAG TPA: PriCT-2 domain-containing protein, partial [Isosphaeraceae bacterium]|nr:PriCT-2 domain-containing protein [Isosphaeraceae bacterium]